MSPYLGGPFYETVGDSEEMKTLRATPPEGKNGEVESGHQVSSIKFLFSFMELCKT